MTESEYDVDRDCPECGSTIIRFRLKDGTWGRWTCTNYGGCELAPG